MQYLGYYYILVPLLFIGLVAFRRHVNRLQWIVGTAPFVLVIVFMWVTARWEIPGFYLRLVFPALMLVACVIGYRKIHSIEADPVQPLPGRFTTAANYVINVAVLVVMGGMTTIALSGYTRPDSLLDLHSPLQGGDFVVLHGGTRPFINAHAKIKPQNFALDIVELNKYGMRANTITGGSNPADYKIFGQTIVAPCAGVVLVAEDGLKDLSPPQTDTENIAGNHVLINCQNFEILLAHMKFNSVRVNPGQKVSIGDVLGQVGNTGNTSEPHLHMHAERGGEANTILNGEAIAFSIEGRFLLRGDRF